MAEPASSRLARAGAAAEARAEARAPGSVVEQRPLAEAWIQSTLATADGAPAAGERWELEDSAGRKKSGVLDRGGLARVEGVRAGACKVRFPGHDTAAPDADGDVGAASSAALYLPGEPASCASGGRHAFRLGDWALTAVEAAKDDDDDEDEADASESEEANDDWELVAYEDVVDEDETEE